MIRAHRSRCIGAIFELIRGSVTDRSIKISIIPTVSSYRVSDSINSFADNIDMSIIRS